MSRGGVAARLGAIGGRTSPLWAKAYGVPWDFGRVGKGHVGSSLHMSQSKAREGCLWLEPKSLPTPHEAAARRALDAFAVEPEDRKRLCAGLQGVEFQSDLPADPLTRIFFQKKADHMLFQGTFDDPRFSDPDRVKLGLRTRNTVMPSSMNSPTFDFCHRVREASQQRKRFVVVPATHETKGVAKIMLRHGIIAGYRDFSNDRAFAIELKYFQNESCLMGIEPVSKTTAVEFEWTARYLKRVSHQFGVLNRVRIHILRTWDGRIIDHVEAVTENIGGRGLLMVW